MKPLLVGEAPVKDDGKPLEGSAYVLVRAMGYNLGGFGAESRREGYDRLYSLFELRNLLDEPQPKQEKGKGSTWPVNEAAAAAERLSLLVESEQDVVFLGKRVAEAFGAYSTDYFRWWTRASPRIRYATIPHPSGVNRVWNKPENRAGAGMVLWQALGKLPK